MSIYSQAKKNLNQISVGEFWTAKQRQSHPIHYAVSYRAAFKPELPSFFIREYLGNKKRVILDPFGGRGTTAIQANLDGHYAIHNDINPLSVFLAKSRQIVPTLSEIQEKLSSLDLKKKVSDSEMDEKLEPFFHKDTLREIKNLKLIGKEDKSHTMSYILLTALSRLHGHSKGFFSVYTFPQFSISPESQRRNNLKRNQKPEYRDIKSRILAKAKRDLSKSLPPFYHEFSKFNQYTNHNSEQMTNIGTSTVDFVITSPPFLDKVNYKEDNWMKCWFMDIDSECMDQISILHSVDGWSKFIKASLKECSRVMKKNAHLVMEVGDIQNGKSVVNLDDVVIQASAGTGLSWEKTYINSQKFTKLSNCWNVSNNEKGTNSNRCVVFRNVK
ncbi:MAG TPA: DNA methyltransferase [Leptospiraceae bacterium]|nr:DNA methyltransferase [Leptospiraceae bacterium]HMX35181.1 DNA methyltransferase [Leptospiraceae bacterium]HMY32268.1 DNA methyltransferase [Leptospiraceae bacterium]HMZ63957.1 DNA methyltransferase [Leptospiraceae bacterium]HNA10318.1 DNA methyltransferase [Leptospiraceae bacterium]